MSRLGKKSPKKICLMIAYTYLLSFVLLSSPLHAVEPGEFEQRDDWIQKQLLSPNQQLPFSFLFDGKKSDELLRAWQHKSEEKQLDEVRTQRILTWTDPASGLEVRCTLIEYADLPAVEWILNLTNTGTKDTPIIEQIRPLDAKLEGLGKEGFTIHRNLGDSNSGQSFAPVEDSLTAEKPGPLILAPSGGRSSEDHLPFFNIDRHDGGIAMAIGWSGQWEAGFDVLPNGSLHFRAGQQLTHLKLHPGETIRTPRMLFVFWSGTDAIRGNNLFRRTMLAHYSPRRDGELVLPPICAGVGWTDADGSYEKPHIEGAKSCAKNGIEVLWSDMNPEQWYPKGFPEGTGNWEVDPKKYPHGFKPIGDAAKAAGVGFLLWFEPERVHPGTKIDREHPEYVMKANGEYSQIFRLGDEKARKWLTDLIDIYVSDAQLAWIRWDFNIQPLGFWRRNDEPDRQGMSEIRYIEGLYAMWDDLRARHPGLVIDNCASGGRRIDIETCSRGIALWHSDMQCFGPKPAADQLQNGGLNLWIPLHGAGNFGLEPSYLFRSSMTAGNVLVAPDLKKLLNDGEPSAEIVRKTVAAYRKLRPLILADFYPLLPHNESEDRWYGYQYDNPENKVGCAFVFRREKCSEENQTICLKGIDPNATYEITDMDGAPAAIMSGKDLVEKGLVVAIKEKPGAAVVLYKKIP